MDPPPPGLLLVDHIFVHPSGGAVKVSPFLYPEQDQTGPPARLCFLALQWRPPIIIYHALSGGVIVGIIKAVELPLPPTHTFYDGLTQLLEALLQRTTSFLFRLHCAAAAVVEGARLGGDLPGVLSVASESFLVAPPRGRRGLAAAYSACMQRCSIQ